MNTFGRIFRVHIFGESHGAGVGVTIDGVKPGIFIDESIFETELKRRQGQNGVGTTPRKEADIPIFMSGVFNQHTTGAPLTLFFENNNIRSSDYSKHSAIPRPSHADFVAHVKYNGFEDYNGGGHFSARLTTGIVAAGVIAQQMILSIIPEYSIQTQFIAVGGLPTIEAGLARAIAHKDSVGAVINCTITGLPIGLGEPFWDSCESVLAHAMFSIPAVKGIQFGKGFEAANMLGTEHNDSIIDSDGTTATNHAGGIVGGITNGNPLSFDLAFKPTASTPKEQHSYNFETAQIEAFSIKGRHDLCVALRAPAIIEAMAHITICDLLLLNKK